MSAGDSRWHPLCTQWWQVLQALLVPEIGVPLLALVRRGREQTRSHPHGRRGELGAAGGA